VLYILRPGTADFEDEGPGIPDIQRAMTKGWTTGKSLGLDSSSATAMWIPMVDIHEYPDRFELYVDLPGVDPATIDLTLDGGILTLSGDRPLPTRKAGEETQGRRVERGHGQFHRRFVLPDSVDSEKVNVTGSHGVLTVTIPKQAKAMPRRIQIVS
jgi:HSP20 family protein